MIDTSHLLRKVDLQILNQNWDRVRKLYNTLTVATNEKRYTSADYEDQYKATHYNFDSKVTLSRTDGLGKNWNILSGPMLNMALPWSKNLKELFKPLKFNHVCMSITVENIALHVDEKRKLDGSPNFCNINYVVYSEDVNAQTNIYDLNDSSIHVSYPSNPGEAWMLDAAHPHELISNSYREILQFKFHNTYQEVAEVLDKIGPIVLDSAKS